MVRHGQEDARRGLKAIPVPILKPVLKPILKPMIEPVVMRLDRHEDLLLQMKTTLDVQFQRIAALQAQMDHLLATIRGLARDGCDSFGS